MNLTLIDISYVLLFVLAVSSLYSIIISNKTNRVITFFLVPLIIAASIISFYAIHSLQGRPKYEWPEGQIEILSMKLVQPTIWLLVRHEGEQEPTLYGVEWNKETVRLLQLQIQERMNLQLSTQGEFKKPKKQQGSGSQADGKRFWEPLKPKKYDLKEK